MILDETCEYEPEMAFPKGKIKELEPSVELEELQPSLQTDLHLKVKRIDTINKGTTKKKQKPGKAKKLVPTDVQLKRREKRLERNKKSAQKSRLRKKEEQAKKKTKEEEMALKNGELIEKIKRLESLKERFETLRHFGTRNQIGTTENDSGRMQLGDKILLVEDERDSFHLPVPNFIFQENYEYIEAASSIQNSYFSTRNIFKTS